MMHKTYFRFGAITFIFSFLFLIYLEWDLLFCFLTSLGSTLLFLGVTVGTDFLGKRKHQNIHDSILFKQLYSDGFELEEYGEYKGLIKNINGHTVRVYYDWYKKAKGLFSFGDIVICFYYQPLILDNDLTKAHKIAISNLNVKYQAYYYLFSVRRVFGIDRLFFGINHYPWTSYKRISKEINKGMEMMKEENLKPMDIQNLDSKFYELEQEGEFLPDMILIWEEVERNN